MAHEYDGCEYVFSIKFWQTFNKISIQEIVYVMDTKKLRLK